MMKFDSNSKKILIKYLLKNLNKIGHFDDSNSLTRLFFILSALDLINCLKEAISDDKRNELIEWIYLQQLQPKNLDDDESFKNGKFGFGCIRTTGQKNDYCSLPKTYLALVSLIILNDDLSRINRQAILRGLKEHQKFDGRFVQSLVEEEDDLRQTYCAATICFILNDWSTIDKNLMISYIKSCQSYENGFGQTPGSEAHGGSTYCAIASLYLMKQLDLVFNSKQKMDIAQWCLFRQQSGFQGRPSKDPDTCYSFWIGSTLTFLNSYKFVNDKENVEFLNKTYNHDTGGFGKYPYTCSDDLHTYMGIGALSLRVYNQLSQQSDDGNGDGGLQSIFPALSISERAYKHLQTIHQKLWK